MDIKTNMDLIIHRDDIRRLYQALPTLSKIERKIIVFRFGLDGNGIHSLRETSMLIGSYKTAERIRQIQNAALKKLREALDPQPQPDPPPEEKKEEEKPWIPIAGTRTNEGNEIIAQAFHTLAENKKYWSGYLKDTKEIDEFIRDSFKKKYPWW